MNSTGCSMIALTAWNASPSQFDPGNCTTPNFMVAPRLLHILACACAMQEAGFSRESRLRLFSSDQAKLSDVDLRAVETCDFARGFDRKRGALMAHGSTRAYAATNPAGCKSRVPWIASIARVLILAALLLALLAPPAPAHPPAPSPAAAPSGPTQDYLVYVVCESADKVVLLRFG